MVKENHPYKQQSLAERSALFLKYASVWFFQIHFPAGLSLSNLFLHWYNWMKAWKWMQFEVIWTDLFFVRLPYWFWPRIHPTQSSVSPLNPHKIFASTVSFARSSMDQLLACIFTLFWYFKLNPHHSVPPPLALGSFVWWPSSPAPGEWAIDLSALWIISFSTWKFVCFVFVQISMQAESNCSIWFCFKMYKALCFPAGNVI